VKIKNLSLAFLIASIFIYLFSVKLVDPDIWGHLKFGQDIFTTLSVPRYDIYSYSSYGVHWLDHEWLSELIFYLIFKFGGSVGLVLFQYFMGIVVTFIVCKHLFINTKSNYLRIIFVALSLPLISCGFAIRPQIFTYVFFTLLLSLIEGYEKNQRPLRLCFIPLIFLFWVNLHGGFIAGLVLFFLYCLFKLFSGKQTKLFAIILLFSIAATFINPYGARVWDFILKAVSKSRLYITEWRRVDFSAEYLNYFILVAIIILGLVFSRIRRSEYKILFLLAAIYFSFQYNRHVTLFAIVVLMYLPEYLDSFLGNWFLRLEKRYSPRILDICFICLAACFILATFNRQKNVFRIEVSNNMYPVEAVSFLKINNISGNIFCDFNWAQMCIRELSPMNRVFLDGRCDTVYSDNLIQDYFDILFYHKDYKSFLVRFPETDVMLLNINESLAHVLSKDRNWVQVYLTPLAQVFLNNNLNNKKHIEDFKNNRLLYPKLQEKYYLDNFR
jgi:hypothetical protein